MNIDRVRVKGLFGDFDHDLAFADDERIMILVGPNGFGKTTTLTLIDMLFNRSLDRLATLPFRELEVAFDDETTLVAAKTADDRPPDPGRLPLTLTANANGEQKEFQPDRSRAKRQSLVDHFSGLPGVGVRERYDAESYAEHDSEDALALYSLLSPRPTELPGWLRNILDSVTVRFVDTERLNVNPPTPGTRLWGSRPPPAPSRTVSLYSKELAALVGKSIARYGSLSQDLDRTFPARLVADGSHSTASIDTLLRDLEAIERKRSQLEEAGLLAPHQSGIEIPDLEGVDRSHRAVLAVYANDARMKLRVFDDLYNKVSAFTRIANSRFRHKRVNVGSEGLTVVKSDGAPLHLEKLSSGEQHELVMLYELLFRTSANSLILIDEPEISLHVAWQERWLKDLEETAALSDFRAIVATHSPEIIGDRWGLTVELRGPNNDS